jgi:cardiolipin synthase
MKITVTRVLKWAGLGLLGLLMFGFTLIGILSITRGTPVRTVRAIGDSSGPPIVEDSLFRHTIELMTSTPVRAGHEVRVLTDGHETYPALFADMRRALSTINIQLYYCNNGVLADSLKNILIDRARAGVRILFLIDAIGSQLTTSYSDSLRAAGIRVETFRPLRWYHLYKWSNRAHLRVVVVDGQVGYTGGFGIDDQWLGDGHTTGWRDTNVRFTGPAVLQLQATFASSWAETTGTLITGDAFFPSHLLGRQGGIKAGLLHAIPGAGSTTAERLFALSIAGAKRSIYLTNAYVVPDDDFRRLLIQAAKRGVDVRIMLPGEKNDVKTTYYAARARYEELIEGGVRIYEFKPAMIHAKTFVIDGVWSTVGSLNFDNRSMAFNEESTLLVADPRIGAVMDSIFRNDLRYADAVDLEVFRRRGLKDRVFEKATNMISRLL